MLAHDSLGMWLHAVSAVTLWWLRDLCPTDWEVLGLWQLERGHLVKIPACCGLC